MYHIYIYISNAIYCTIYRTNSIAIREQFNFNFDFLNKLTKTKKYDMRKKTKRTLRKYIYIYHCIHYLPILVSIAIVFDLFMFIIRII